MCIGIIGTFDGAPNESFLENNPKKLVRHSFLPGKFKYLTNNLHHKTSGVFKNLFICYLHKYKQRF